MEFNPELIVMLTYNDVTVENASEIFKNAKNSKAKFWGFKESGIPLNEMKSLFSEMKLYEKNTALEVVAYTESECLDGAKMAKECKCDILMGTCFFDSVNEFCKENNIKYMPFVGDVSGKPSVLNGEISDIIDEAKEYIKKGVYGFDLLAYRYTGDVKKLIETFSREINAPVCIAGSVDTYEKLQFLKEQPIWALTIGSAFFQNKFGEGFEQQINEVNNFLYKETVKK
ncbi:MAG: hypothetical protein IKC01_09930 [Clostridia bacterium]|nr:hypothetical protein [Clostridia bacterium]